MTNTDALRNLAASLDALAARSAQREARMAALIQAPKPAPRRSWLARVVGR
jgi:hypothetical protein